MGLFGGFKAKFTKNSTTKVKPQEVVCLKYHVQEEFDRQDVPLAVPVRNNVKQNEVASSNSKTKARKAIAKSAIFQDNDTSYTPLSSPGVSQKSRSMTNLNGEASKPVRSLDNKPAEPSNAITVTTTIEVPSNSNSIAVAGTQIDRNIGERNGVVTENVMVTTNNHLYSTSNDVKTEKHQKTILKTFSTSQNERADKGSEANGHSEPSTLIFMTQHTSETYEKKMENGEDNFSPMSNGILKPNRIQTNTDFDEEEDEADGNFNIGYVPNKAFDEEDDFKVNHVQHDLGSTYSYSEDDKSYQEEEPIQFTKMGFSSQAASIFFGEDVEPEVTRPRRIMLKNDDEDDRDDDDDDRRSSGADC